MAKRHFLRLLLRSGEDMVFEVYSGESERLWHVLSSADADAMPGFFWVDALDGRSIIVNLACVQGVRFLWEPSAAPADMLRYDGPITIKLIGREPITESTGDEERLYDMFRDLEMAPTGWTSFVDVDGEEMFLRAPEVEWITAPAHVVEEGRGAAQDDHDP